MRIITDRVYPSEPAHGIFEGPENGRWLQKVWVVRGDALACYETDFGPAENFEGITPLLMPGFGDDSVAVLQAFAEKNREDDYWQKRGIEMLEASTLIQDHVRQVQVDHEIIHNRSVFGPSITVQRNAYPHERAMRQLKEKTDAYYGSGQWNRSKKR